MGRPSDTGTQTLYAVAEDDSNPDLESQSLLPQGFQGAGQTLGAPVVAEDSKDAGRAADATRLQIIIVLMSLYVVTLPPPLTVVLPQHQHPERLVWTLRQVLALFGVGTLDHSIALVSMGFHVLADVFSYAIALW